MAAPGPPEVITQLESAAKVLMVRKQPSFLTQDTQHILGFVFRVNFDAMSEP